MLVPLVTPHSNESYETTDVYEIRWEKFFIRIVKGSNKRKLRGKLECVQKAYQTEQNVEEGIRLTLESVKPGTIYWTMKPQAHNRKMSEVNKIIKMKWTRWNFLANTSTRDMRPDGATS
jgi:hypothetical protein